MTELKGRRDVSTLNSNQVILESSCSDIVRVACHAARLFQRGTETRRSVNWELLEMLFCPRCDAVFV